MLAPKQSQAGNSKLFPPRPQWEMQGYRADEDGHWLKGNWWEVEALSLELETSASEHQPSSLELEASRSAVEWSGSELETLSLELDRSGSERHLSTPKLEALRSQVEMLGSKHDHSDGIIRSTINRSNYSIDEVKDVELPLYQGVLKKLRCTHKSGVTSFGSASAP